MHHRVLEKSVLVWAPRISRCGLSWKAGKVFSPLPPTLYKNIVAVKETIDIKAESTRKVVVRGFIFEAGSVCSLNGNIMVDPFTLLPRGGGGGGGGSPYIQMIGMIVVFFRGCKRRFSIFRGCLSKIL